jgi:outer membrane protein OmpA-like peptidoglycan-associated protein
MRHLPLFLVALMTVLPSLSPAADKASCTDHALFPTRMPEFSLVDCKTEEYGTYAFQTANNAKVTTPVEGKFTFITYSYTGPRGGEPSALAMVRNYEAAIAKVGGTIVYSDPTRWVTGKVVKDGKEAWFQAEKGNGKIWLRIVEKKAMTQYIVADAAAFGNDINATGHVAVYGIYFDTNKSEVKPDSRPALEEIAKLLAQSPGLKLLVVGHTDMTGSLDANMKLSQARAESVVQALVSQHGVAPARLKGHGVGPLAPVATNDTEEGRAKNRRVELVKE